jgi:hypothetical protein
MSRTYTRILLFTVWSGRGVPKFQRCPVSPSAYIYPNDGASTHVSHTFALNPKDKGSLVYVRCTFFFSGWCFWVMFRFHVHRPENVHGTSKLPKLLPSAGNWLVQASNAKVSWGHIKNFKNRYDCPSHASIWFGFYRSCTTGNVRFNVTLRRLRVTIVTVQKQEVLRRIHTYHSVPMPFPCHVKS